ncbi:hypothetical protein FOCC_FOCC011234 [Frankliniella occidentalis]|nr:hypothetical protein FOCC_FOCC011234 [Frankliniella occidentalis]
MVGELFRVKTVIAKVLVAALLTTSPAAGRSCLRRRLERVEQAESSLSAAEIFSQAAALTFEPRHSCVAVVLVDDVEDATPRTVPVAALLRRLSLPVVLLGVQGWVCVDMALRFGRQSSEWPCSAAVLLARSYPAAVLGRVAARADFAVLVALTEALAEDSAFPEQAIACSAALVSLASGRRWRLSDAYLAPPRVWLREHDGDERATRRVDFQGRMLRVAAFHQPPLLYIDDPSDPGPEHSFVCSHREVRHDHVPQWRPSAAESMSGMEGHVLRMLAEHLNFTLSLVRLAESERWGRPDGRGSWRGGVLGALVSGRADLAPGAWVQLDQARVVDFAQSTRMSCLTFMAPRPRLLLASGNAVFLPLRPTVWACWGAAIAVASVSGRALHVAARRAAAATGKHFASLDRCLLVLLGGAVAAYIPRSTASLGPHRHLVAWWVVFAMLMTTAYSSGLIAQLTLSRFEAVVDTPEDIVRNGLTWVSTFAPNLHVMMNLENEAERRVAEDLRLVDGAHWEEAVASGRHVVHGQRLDRVYFFWEGGNLGSATLSRLRVMRSCLVTYPAAVAVARGSPLLAVLNPVLLRLTQAGLVAYWQDIVLATRGRSAVFALLADGGERRAGPKSMASALPRLERFHLFLMLLFLVTYALVVYVTSLNSSVWSMASALPRLERFHLFLMLLFLVTYALVVYVTSLNSSVWV